jgi:pimeloyl-ACP methyl ester carboxylesterase
MTYHSVETENRGTCFYLDTGSGTPVLLLHCGSGSGDAWMPVIKNLGQNYRALAPDLLGYGRNSPWPVDATLTLESELQAIEPLLDVASEPIHLVGHSYGGAIALAAAQRHPGRIASMTLIEPVAFQLLREADETDSWREIVSLAERHIALVAEGKHAEAAGLFMGYWIGPAAWQSLHDIVRNNIIQTMPKTAAEWKMMLAMESDLRSIAAIDIPVLLAYGARTRKPPRKVVELLGSILPHVRHSEIADAGHMSPLTHPMVVADLIRTHIGAVRSKHRPAA